MERSACSLGNANVILRVYMWIRQLGADGLREAAVCAVLNNQYMMKKVGQIKGVKIFYAEGNAGLANNAVTAGSP
ncbi:MAG: hypothetical protein ACLTBV_26945 [Enterocloster bolteae]